MIKWRYFMMIVRTRSAVGSTINDESFSWANSMPDDVDIVAIHEGVVVTRTMEPIHSGAMMGAKLIEPPTSLLDPRALTVGVTPPRKGGIVVHKRAIAVDTPCAEMRSVADASHRRRRRRRERAQEAVKSNR
jgi:hypothetical protein